MVPGPPMAHKDDLPRLTMMRGHPADLGFGVPDLGNKSDGWVSEHPAPFSGQTIGL